MDMVACGRRQTASATPVPVERITGVEQGGVLLLLSLLMIAVIGSAGLVVDVRNGYVVRAMLQHAVDDGALSAQRWSAQADDAAPGQSADTVRGAVAEAMRVVQQELQSDGLAGISTAAATLSGGHLTLTAHSRVPTFFLTLFGIGHWLPAVRAEAALWAPGMPFTPLAGQGTRSDEGLTLEAAAATRGEGGGTALERVSVAGGVPGSTAARASPGAASPDQVDIAGSCNCDAIAAGDPQTAREILERMGVTPADPGPFHGDLT